MKRENVYPNEMLDRVWPCSPTVELADAENYYTKGQVDRLISGITVSGVTEEELNQAIASAKTEIEAEIPTYTAGSGITISNNNVISAKIWSGTLEAYNAIPVKDNDTIYLVY